jgi:hypothetical protein
LAKKDFRPSIRKEFLNWAVVEWIYITNDNRFLTAKLKKWKKFVLIRWWARQAGKTW